MSEEGEPTDVPKGVDFDLERMKALPHERKAQIFKVRKNRILPS